MVWLLPIRLPTQWIPVNTRSRTGRRTRYTVNRDSLFRHPAREGHRVGPFLALLASAKDTTSTPPGPDDV
jgi:hypothetical protein